MRIKVENLTGIIETLPEEEKVAVELKAEPVQEQPKKKGGRKKIDRGKVGALYKGNWSVADIASEMGCKPETIEGIIKEIEK